MLLDLDFDMTAAFQASLLDAMIDHLAAAGIDESVRVIRIDADGPDFCAGADLIANNRKLLEETLYRVRKLEFDHSRRAVDEDVHQEVR